MKKIGTIFCILYYGFTITQPVTRLTLEEVISMGKQQSIAARQAITTRETKYWEWKTFLSNSKAQLVLNGNLPAFSRSFTQVVQPDGTIQFQPIRYNNSSLDLSLFQSVEKTGRRIYAATQLQRFDDFARNNRLYNSSPFAIGYEQPLFKFNPLKWDSDLDIFVRPSADNATGVYRALARFGAPLAAHGVTESDFAVEGTVYQLGLPPRRIAILTSISGVTFDEAWAGRLSADLHGRSMTFLGRDELLRNKRASARPKDLADVAALERERGDG